MDLTPARRGYHRDLNVAIDAVLRIARIDQRALIPARFDTTSLRAALDCVATVCFLLKTDTVAQWKQRQRACAAAGAPPQRQLTDYTDISTHDP